MINKFILDTGCGNGSLAVELIKKGFNVYGIDASDEGINIAKKNYPSRFFIQDLNFDKLPPELANIKFDTILSTEVIEHLYDPRGYIKFCKNCLTGKGILIITTPYHGYLKNLFLSLANKWDSHHGPLWDGGHIKFWSRKTITKLLNEFGFEVITFSGAGRVPFIWKSMIIKAELK
jgi:2-polyprenyl-3-methyl-5-hydroxy-6-metoxy-1,4-benzoquinol methylase